MDTIDPIYKQNAEENTGSWSTYKDRGPLVPICDASTSRPLPVSRGTAADVDVLFWSLRNDVSRRPRDSYFWSFVLVSRYGFFY